MNPKILLQDIATIKECSVQNVHKLIKSKNINSNKSNHRVYLDGESAREIIDKKIPKKTISIQTAKGGVGKTTISFSLGIRLSLLGAKVLFLDIDQQGNLSKTLGSEQPKYVLQDILEKKCSAKESLIKISNSIGLIPSNLRNAMINSYMQAYSMREDRVIKTILKSFENDYDIVIIDCPPAVGSIVTSATIASDMIIAPLDPDIYAVDGIKMCHQEVERLKEEYELDSEFKILLNKYDARTILSTKIIAQLTESEDYGNCLFNTVIGVSQEFPKAMLKGVSIFESVKQEKACKDIDSLAKEILEWNEA